MVNTAKITTILATIASSYSYYPIWFGKILVIEISMKKLTEYFSLTEEEKPEFYYRYAETIVKPWLCK